MNKICIVANNAYGAMTGEATGHIGGVERQTALLSAWLQSKGFQVSVITWNEGGPNVEVVNGIQIIKLCKITDGIPGLRFLTPRWTSLIKAMAKADADAYYHNCCEYVTGQVALWCKLKRRKFIYSVASDADCSIDLPGLKHHRERILFKYGIKNADKVICQTNSQKTALKTNYNLNADVVPMPGTPPKHNNSHTDDDRFNSKQLLWVARLSKTKRVEWMLDVAKNLPDTHINIVGPYNDEMEYLDPIIKEIESRHNMTYHGKKTREEVSEIFQQHSVFCCTSNLEGFPNTFLEAWSYGIPLVSTFDPDNIIERFRLGLTVSNPNEFSSAVTDLLSNKNLWDEFSKNSKHYFEKNHTQEATLNQFEDIFRLTCGNK